MNFKRKILDNGLRIITVPMQDNKTVTVMALVEAGSKYETKNINGISHFLEHMVFKGTKRRLRAQDITHELDALGAQYNAFTDTEYTGYYAKGTAEKFDRLIDVVSDIYLNATFPKEELERERGVVIEEINMYRDNPRSVAQDVLVALMYGDQPAGWTILGPKDNITSLQRKDFVSYKKKHYVAEGTTVIVAGNINHKKVVRAIEEKFADIPTTAKSGKKKVKISQQKAEVKVHYRKTDQAHLLMGFRSVDTYHADRYILQVLAGVLGKGMSSRLFQKLREEMGVAYYTYAYNDFSTDHGSFVIGAGVDTKRVEEVIQVLIDECRRLREIPVHEPELQKVKDYLLGNTFLSLESSDAFAQFYGFQEILRRDLVDLDELSERIRSVTAEDVMRLAKETFIEKNLNLAVVGPYKNAASFEKVLRKLDQ